jgi:ATP-dependent NAD(P)H-hydrate dehydratase
LAAVYLNVFCPLNVAPIIKSRSHEPIVYPVMDTADALRLIKLCLPRLHMLIIGPGLGRDPETLETVGSISFADTNQIMESRL